MSQLTLAHKDCYLQVTDIPLQYGEVCGAFSILITSLLVPRVCVFLWLHLCAKRKVFCYCWVSPGKSLYCDGEDTFPFIQVMNTLVIRMLSLEDSLLCSVIESSGRKTVCLDSFFLLSYHMFYSVNWLCLGFNDGNTK